jgi:hypothetical protein
MVSFVWAGKMQTSSFRAPFQTLQQTPSSTEGIGGELVKCRLHRFQCPALSRLSEDMRWTMEPFLQLVLLVSIKRTTMVCFSRPTSNAMFQIAFDPAINGIRVSFFQPAMLRNIVG